MKKLPCHPNVGRAAAVDAAREAPAGRVDSADLAEVRADLGAAVQDSPLPAGLETVMAPDLAPVAHPADLAAVPADLADAVVLALRPSR